MQTAGVLFWQQQPHCVIHTTNAQHKVHRHTLCGEEGSAIGGGRPSPWVGRSRGNHDRTLHHLTTHMGEAGEAATGYKRARGEKLDDEGGGYLVASPKLQLGDTVAHR